jgi:hypothetical protein
VRWRELKLTDTGPTIAARKPTEGRRRLLSSQQLLLYYILFDFKAGVIGKCRNPDPILDLRYTSEAIVSFPEFSRLKA